MGPGYDRAMAEPQGDLSELTTVEPPAPRRRPWWIRVLRAVGRGLWWVLWQIVEGIGWLLARAFAGI